MSVVSRGVRNAFRNSIRTFSIVIILGLSIGLALTMLIARQAVQDKITSVKSSIGNTITVSPAGARGFEGGGEPLTMDQMTKVKSLPHVVSVTEMLQDRLQSTTDTNLQSSIAAGSLGRRFNRGGGESGNFGGGNTNFTPPITVVASNSLDNLQALGGGAIRLTNGKTFDPNVDAAVALVGSSLATKNNLTTGSTFQAYGTNITVAGIFDAGNTFSNSGLVMPLPTLQRLSSQTGDISSAIVQADSISNLETTTASIKNTLGDAADVVSQQDTSSQALAPLDNIKNISLYSLIGAVVAGAVIILLTMLMIVRERRREIGVLKAIGASNIKVMFQFMTEAITFTILGAIVGLIGGALASGPITKLLVAANTGTGQAAAGTARGMGRGFGGGGFGGGLARIAGERNLGLGNIHATVGWEILLYGLAAALIIAIVGSAIPAWFISKVRPAEVMRAE